MRTLMYAHFYEVVLTQNLCIFSSRKSFFNARLATKSIWLHIDSAFNLYEDYPDKNAYPECHCNDRFLLQTSDVF